MWNLIQTLVAPALDKAMGLIPNPNARARAREELELTLATATQQASLAQMEINKTEAAHRSLFVAGWRPFIGWVCGVGIFWAFVGHPLAQWIADLARPGLVELPSFNTDVLLELVLAMLGMGSLRTWEKIKGVARSR